MAGYICRISGSVTDVRFENENLPKIKEALKVEINGKEKVMEVAGHVSRDTVRCIMLSESSESRQPAKK